MGHFNGGLTRTTSIDALISQGVLLERFHTFKVCAPSRASTMSGRYQFNVGFYEMPKDDANQCLSNTTLLPELLREMGYTTHALGSALLRKAFATVDFTMSKSWCSWTTLRRVGRWIHRQSMHADLPRLRNVPRVL